MKFTLTDKYGYNIVDTDNPIEDWQTNELFEFLVAASIISPDEDFEDWKNDRARMLELTEEHTKENEE